MNEEIPPEFNDWAKLLVDGLKLYVIAVAYFIVPYSMFFAVGFVIGGSDGGSVVGTVVAFVAGIALLAGAYVLPAALTNFALQDSIGAAFDFGTVLGAAFTSRYLVAVILAVVVGTVLSFIGGVLSVIIIGLFVLFYSQMFTFYIAGRGCGPKLVGGPRSTEQAIAE